MKDGAKNRVNLRAIHCAHEVFAELCSLIERLFVALGEVIHTFRQSWLTRDA
jgi:hypothetical protein